MDDILTTILLFFGVAVSALAALGIVAMRGMYDKLHYLSPMSTLGAGAILGAVLLQEGVSLSGAKALLVVVLLAGSGAVLTQATARAKGQRDQRIKAKSRES